MDLTLHKANSYLYIHVYLTFSSFVLFRVASSPEQQGRYVRTRVLPSRPFTTKRGYVDGDSSSGMRFAENSRQTYRRLETKLQDFRTKYLDHDMSTTAFLRACGSLYGVRLTTLSTEAKESTIGRFVDYSRRLVLSKCFINVILDYI